MKVTAWNPSRQVREEMPLWYHTKAAPVARRLYQKKAAKCLRRTHGIRLVQDATNLLAWVGGDHTQAPDCRCGLCSELRTSLKCTHPIDCITMAADLLSKINLEWNPAGPEVEAESRPNDREGGDETEGILVQKETTVTDLRDMITIFREPEEANRAHHIAPGVGPLIRLGTTTVYTDGACLNNGSEDAQAGCGVWYGKNDPRTISKRQSNQTGELEAVLQVVKSHDPHNDLLIVSDSKYVTDGLTKHLARWEQRGWIDVAHGGLFKNIIMWIRWRTGRTFLKWTKGHNGTEGNEGADKLAGEGARKPHNPTNEDSNGATPRKEERARAQLAKLEQRDFYRILRDRRKLPTRRSTD